MSKPKISVITPVYNEEECLPEFFRRVGAIMDETGYPYEIIAVNDGSNDRSFEIMAEYCKTNKRIKAIGLSRNFGQQPAFLCGLANCSGDCAILIDADLQDPPEIFPDMIAEWSKGYDVVHGIRRKRRGETIFKKFTSAAFMSALSDMSGIKMPKGSGEFKLYDRKVINAILSLPERNRYLRIQTAWVGFKETYVEFDRAERELGKTKFTVKKMLKTAEAGIIPYSKKPLSLSLKTGMFLGVCSIAAFITFAVLAIIGYALPLTAWIFPSIGVAVSLLLGANGISNVYLGYIYDETKHRPVYVVRDKINFEDDND